MGNFRLAYPATIPFSKAVTIILCVLYVLGFSGLLVFNFLTQAKIRRCATYTSGIYYPDSCDAGTLEFARTYYSRPVDDVKGQSGVFPWTPLGFGLGGDTGPVDYSLLRTNWTGQSMSCIMYEQIVTLHLDSGGWTVAACYYCGGSLRLLCTTLDSERTQLAGDPASSRVDVGGAMTAFRNSIQTVATTAFEGAIVLSARMIVKRAVSSQFVQPSTLPHNTSSSIVILGTTIGSGVIYANDTSAAIADLAADGLAISTLAEQSTADDIQPEGTPRTLQASYLCRRCENEYKPTLEIVAVVGAAIFAILTPAFAAARLVAELLAPKKDNSSSLEASSLPGTDPSYKPAATPGNQYAGQASPLMYQPYNSYNHY